jgi:hypothetical protein
MQEIKFMQQLQNNFSKIEKEMSEHALRAILQQLQNRKRNKRTCI